MLFFFAYAAASSLERAAMARITTCGVASAGWTRALSTMLASLNTPKRRAFSLFGAAFPMTVANTKPYSMEKKHLHRVHHHPRSVDKAVFRANVNGKGL